MFQADLSQIEVMLIFTCVEISSVTENTWVSGISVPSMLIIIRMMLGNFWVFCSTVILSLHQNFHCRKVFSLINWLSWLIMSTV
jgi:hypothetical protein